MPNLSNLKAAIQAVIKTNGNNEITGAILQKSFTDFIEAISAGYVFRGVATPSTNPGAIVDANVFYLASQNGTYTNFGNYSLSSGIVIFTNSGTGGAWQAANLIIDPKPVTEEDTINRDIYLECDPSDAVQIDTQNKRIKITGSTRLILRRPSKAEIAYSFNNQNSAWITSQVGGDYLMRLYADVVTDLSGNQNVAMSSLVLSNSTFMPSGTMYLLGIFLFKNGTTLGYFSCKHNIYVDGKPIMSDSGGTTPSNAQITLQQGGVTKGSFTLNQSTPATINLDAAGSGGAAINTQVFSVNKTRGGFNINMAQNRIEITGGGMSTQRGGFEDMQALYYTTNDGNYPFSHTLDDDLYYILVEQGGKIWVVGSSGILMTGPTNPILIGKFYRSNGQVQGFHINNNDVKINGSYPFNVGGGAATNLFNPATVVDGMGISVIDGSLYANPDKAVSGVITGITPGATYTIIGFAQGVLIMNMRIRFLDSSNNPLKPIPFGGSTSTDFDVPYTHPATSVVAPANATGMQFVIREVNSAPPVLSNIQVYKQ